LPSVGPVGPVEKLQHAIFVTGSATNASDPLMLNYATQLTFKADADLAFEDRIVWDITEKDYQHDLSTMRFEYNVTKGRLKIFYMEEDVEVATKTFKFFDQSLKEWYGKGVN